MMIMVYSWDEELSRLNGIVSFNYILEKLNILENLKYDKMFQIK